MRRKRKRIIEWYDHHGTFVAVDSALKGTHREHCLCHVCGKFFPGKKQNCTRAQQLYEFCEKYNMTTPVFECSIFAEV